MNKSQCDNTFSKQDVKRNLHSNAYKEVTTSNKSTQHKEHKNSETNISEMKSSSNQAKPPLKRSKAFLEVVASDGVASRDSYLEDYTPMGSYNARWVLVQQLCSTDRYYIVLVGKD